MRFEIKTEKTATGRDQTVCEIYLEDDLPIVRILRDGALVSEILYGAVSDPETFAREIQKARRLELFPKVVSRLVESFRGEYLGVPEEGLDPAKRRELYARGFLAAVRVEPVPKGASRSLEIGHEHGSQFLRFVEELAEACKLDAGAVLK